MAWFVFVGGAPEYLAWHDTVCAAEHIPHPGANQHDRAVALDATWTTAYANAWQLVDGRLVVNLEATDPHTAGLTPTVVDTGDPVTGDRGDLDGATPITDHKQLPPRWEGQQVPAHG
jgi:hypothetical protein